MNNHIWKDIGGYEGMYQVSNTGLVRSLDKFVKNKDKFRLHKGRVLSPSIGNSGYKHVQLSHKGKQKSFDVHRLVALTFIENANHELIVNHKDGNRLNNNLSNLELVTDRQNAIHAIKVLGRKVGVSKPGALNPMFGKRHTIETKLKISQKLRNRNAVSGNL